MLSSLPDRPLTFAETRALEAGGRIDVCRPIVGLRDGDPTQRAVAVYLGVGDAVRLLVFDSAAGGWNPLESFSVTDSPAVVDEATDRVLEWAVATYGRDRIAVIASDAPESDAVLSLFPPRPVGRDEALELAELVDVETVQPVFCFEETHGIIAVLLTVLDHVDPSVATFYAVGYDETTAGWEVVVERAIGPDDEPGPELGDAVFDWVHERYDDDRIAVIAPSER